MGGWVDVFCLIVRMWVGVVLGGCGWVGVGLFGCVGVCRYV